jgi:lysophospholipase L1-like esterase
VAADPSLGDTGDELDRRFFDADRVHLNNTGLAEIAKMVYRVLKGL